MLGKITEILDAFSLTRPDMSLGEIQQATGLPTSTVQRLVSNMAAQGLLDRTGDRIRVGVRMSYWAATALKDLDVLAVVNSVLKEIRDKTGETACFFKVEQSYRVCVAVAETRHALRRDMYVGKVIPLHVGSASRVLLAWNPDLAEQILAAPLEPMTDFTVTSPEDLRGLIAAGQGRWLRDHGRRTRGFGFGSFDAVCSTRRATSSVRSRSAGRPSACRMRGARSGSTSRSVTPSRSQGRSAAVFRTERAEELLGGVLDTSRKEMADVASPVPEQLSAPSSV